MRTIKISCNRCGKEILGKPIHIMPAYTDRETQDIIPEISPYENEQKEKDYCDECTQAIIEFANTPPKNEPQPETPSDNPKPTYEKHDIKKILELKEQGLTYKEIGAQLGRSPQGIAVAVSAYRKKQAKKENDGPEEAPAAEPEPVEQPKEEVPEKKIDYGKVYALSNAGWPAKEIAAELSISEDEAEKAIIEAKKRGVVYV